MGSHYFVPQSTLQIRSAPHELAPYLRGPIAFVSMRLLLVLVLVLVAGCTAPDPSEPRPPEGLGVGEELADPRGTSEQATPRPPVDAPPTVPAPRLLAAGDEQALAGLRYRVVLRDPDGAEAAVLELAFGAGGPPGELAGTYAVRSDPGGELPSPVGTFQTQLLGGNLSLVFDSPTTTRTVLTWAFGEDPVAPATRVN